MRRIIGGAFVSMDGVMQAPGGPSEDTTGGFEHGGWIAALFEEGLGHQVDTLFKEPFDLLLGRRTYDIFAAHWPFVPADDEIGQKFSRCRKYVLTRGDQALEWDGSERVPGFDALAKIKAGDGADMVIQGSTTLYPQLLERGLLDRLVVMTAPIVLGNGKRLFGNGTPASAFKLAEQRVTPGGFVMSSYEVAGNVQTGDFGMAEPTPQERARQKQMRAGTW